MDASRSKQKFRQLNSALNKLNISSELSYHFIRIRQYLSFNWKSEHIESQDDISFILSSLPPQIKSRVNVETNQIVFEKCPYFRNHFTDKFKKALSLHFRQYSYQPQTYIDDKSFYLIKQGQVEVIYDNESIFSDFNSPVLSKNQYFNLPQFLTNQSTKERYKTRTFTHLITLHPEDFQKVLEEFPDEKEKYFQQRQDLQNGSLECSYLKCQGCQLTGHLISSCPKLHYKIDREKILKAHIFPILQERKQFARKTTKRQVPNLKYLEEDAQTFQTENQDNCKIYQIIDVDMETSPDKICLLRKKSLAIKVNYNQRIVKKFQKAALAMNMFKISTSSKLYNEFAHKQQRKIQRYGKLNELLLERLALMNTSQMQQDIHFYQLQIQKQIRLVTGDEMNFDIFKNYTYYRPLNNIRSILAHNESENQAINEIRCGMMPYFMYPDEIIKKFFDNKKQQEEQTHRKTNRQMIKSRFVSSNENRVFPTL